jgi:hypothetical protein
MKSKARMPAKTIKKRIVNFSMENSKSSTPCHAACLMLQQICNVEVLQLLGSAVLVS